MRCSLRIAMHVCFAALVSLIFQNPSAAQSQFVSEPSNQTRLLVFVHGLGNSGDENPKLAWSRGHGNWPEHMDSDAVFKRSFAILMFQYGTHHFRGNFPIQGLSRELSIYLAKDDKLANFEEVYFVAHSLGGLVVRNALLNDKPLAKKTKGIFLFATPMGGSDVATLARTLGIGSLQTMQLGDSPDSPDAVFSTIKDLWYQREPNIPSFCAYETERTRGALVVPRLSVEPLCSHDVAPLRGAHTDIIAPSREETFFAHELVRSWMARLLPDFQEAAKASEEANQIVVANCNGNNAYDGPYGQVHARLKDFLAGENIRNVRYSLPLSQSWLEDISIKSIFTSTAPSHIIIHLSCFQNIAGNSEEALRLRNNNFFAFMRSFSTQSTKIIIYSSAFRREDRCQFVRDRLDANGIANSYKGRLTMVALWEGEVPGDGSKGDERIKAALTSDGSGGDCLR